MDTSNTTVKMSAIDRRIEVTIPSSEEKVQTNSFVKWGDGNNYPDFLWNTYENCSTLQTIISNTTDYVLGDGIKCLYGKFSRFVNRKGETLESLIGKIVVDYMVYGAFALNVIRDNAGQVSELYHIDVRNIRTNEDNQVFWYSTEFSKKYGRTGNAVVLPKFLPEGNAPSSILYVKNRQSRGTYPTCQWSGAIKSALIQNKIDTFHYNELENGFMPSYVLNFNNGSVTDEEKNEIESEVTEKFCSPDNAGRILLSFNKTKDNALTIEKVDVEDYGEKYDSLANRSESKLFMSFGMHPVLGGVASTDLGFSDEPFEEAFKLYNRTKIKPLQRIICDAFETITGLSGCLEIKPFSIDWNSDNNEQTVD